MTWGLGTVAGTLARGLGALGALLAPVWGAVLGAGDVAVASAAT